VAGRGVLRHGRSGDVVAPEARATVASGVGVASARDGAGAIGGSARSIGIARNAPVFWSLMVSLLVVASCGRPCREAARLNGARFSEETKSHAKKELGGWMCCPPRRSVRSWSLSDGVDAHHAESRTRKI
jgi:hypothetical protein